MLAVMGTLFEQAAHTVSTSNHRLEVAKITGLLSLFILHLTAIKYINT